MRNRAGERSRPQEIRVIGGGSRRGAIRLMPDRGGFAQPGERRCPLCDLTVAGAIPPWASPCRDGAARASRYDTLFPSRCPEGSGAAANCCSSVLPVSAVIEELPPVTVCVTASK